MRTRQLSSYTRRWSSKGFVVTAASLALALGAAACNGILGISDVEVVGGDGGTVGPDGTIPGQEGGVLPDGAPNVDSGPGVTITGAVHFLQEAGSLTLASGADSVVVSKNGAFELRIPGNSTGNYDVKVTKNPAGQECWVQNGAGAKASPTPGLEVRCTVIKSSIGKNTAQIATRSSTYAPIDDVDGITFTNDVPARTMLTFSVPSMRGIDNDRPMWRIGILVDDVLAAESLGRVENGAPVNTPVVVMHLPMMPAGKHTVRTVWKKVDGLNPGGQQRDIYREHVFGPGSEVRPELDVVVLDSLSTFDRLASSELTTQQSYAAGGAELAAGIPDLEVTTVKQYGLFMASLPDLSQEPVVRLLLDGTAASVQRKFVNGTNSDQLLSYIPSAFREVEAMKHTLSATVQGLGSRAPAYGMSAGESGLPTNAKKAAALHALLWKPAAKAAAFDSFTRVDVTPPAAAESVMVPGSAVELTVDRPSKALVMLDITQLNGELSGSNSPIAEAAVWVNDTRGPGAVVGRQGFDDGLRSGIFTRYGIVDLPAGKSTIDVRFRNAGGFPMYTVGAVRMGAVVLE
ncbi:MAG: hypothetical protein JST00_38110 [Deltaproteobacteria bacterium]|nr:hypothetical protein [Deltaproteobacteria bacterium]